jgi:hypothetical protein
MVMGSGAPEAHSIASGDQGFWTRYQDGMRAGTDALRAASKDFLEAIEP